MLGLDQCQRPSGVHEEGGGRQLANTLVQWTAECAALLHESSAAIKLPRLSVIPGKEKEPRPTNRLLRLSETQTPGRAETRQTCSCTQVAETVKNIRAHHDSRVTRTEVKRFNIINWTLVSVEVAYKVVAMKILINFCQREKKNQPT